jgi:hypothetical protein
MECKKCGVKAHSNLCWKCKPKQPLKRSRIKQKVYSIAFRSKKRQKQEKEYSSKRKEFLEKFPECEVENCDNPANQIHHQKGRIGDLLTDEKYFLAVCPWCHTWIENNPEQAKEMDYSCSRLAKE